MHFLCRCGYRLHDSSDLISYKGTIIADQDMNEFWSLIEKAEKPHAEICDIFSSLNKLMMRCIYQCPSCGRLFIEDQSDNYQLIRFTPCIEGEPEPDVSKNLLISAYEENWKGSITAEWFDEKPWWSECHGTIMPQLNVRLDDLKFDDYPAFEKRFYELLDDLKARQLLNYAVLKVNGRKIFRWQE